jgi:hypothetical protein
MRQSQPISVATAMGSYACILAYTSLVSSWTPGVFYTYTYSYNHARRLRLGIFLYVGPSRSSNGYFKPLLYPGGRFDSETVTRRFQN